MHPLIAVKGRRLSRALRRPSILLSSDHCPLQSPPHDPIHTFLSSSSSGTNRALHMWKTKNPMDTCRFRAMAPYSSTTSADEGTPTDTVKELYDKMFTSVAQQRTMPPNAWLWSLIEKCSNREDIKLLFDLLTRLRMFRLSSLRIHADFNCNLCREITKACTRVGAIDFGLKALWKHNVYGLSPSIGSAHHLLMHAKEHNDDKLLVDIMKLLNKNDLPLQSGTADVVFSICCNTNNWELLSKYAKRFVKGGVKLRQTSFDLWMAYAANRGEVDSLWKIEKLRSDSMKQHTLVSAFSCAKGFLLEHKPEEAAAVVQVVNQTLSDSKRPGVMVELQKLCSEWPFEVIKHQKEEDKKALAASLPNEIPTMVSMLMSLGLAVKADLEDLLLCHRATRAGGRRSTQNRGGPRATRAGGRRSTQNRGVRFNWTTSEKAELKL